MNHPKTFQILGAIKTQLEHHGFNCGGYCLKNGHWQLNAGQYLIKISIGDIVDVVCVTRATKETTGYSCPIDEVYQKGIKHLLISALMNETGS